MGHMDETAALNLQIEAVQARVEWRGRLLEEIDAVATGKLLGDDGTHAEEDNATPPQHLGDGVAALSRGRRPSGLVKRRAAGPEA